MFFVRFIFSTFFIFLSSYSFSQNHNKIEVDLERVKKDIKNISAKLKKKQLSNIYSGRELSIVLKKSNDGLNSIIKANTIYSTLSLEAIMGIIFSPLMWLIGVASADIVPMGQLLGI